ncbi:leucine-rich repeat-containing protein 74A-like isoform X2 [Mizuhopecten yessoensis]|uniref:leucine-rich repeat-containing protein 74A-like isoform X2 n=1 Tax=Mizuhopecten yessoensis TaxID=6573 RepID=UPI000B45EF06|nr:leucine-rich repeat-containing protein 74A-like isoform X2 [Mizuhopecten yessoensis]
MKLSKVKALARWERLRQYVRAGCYRLLIPPEEYFKTLADMDDLMYRMDTRERTFYERQSRFRKPKGLNRELSRLSSKSLSTGNLSSRSGESCFNGDSVSSVEVPPLPVIPDMSPTPTKKEYVEDYDYDANEDVKLEDVKTFVTPRRKTTKTADIYLLACKRCKATALSNYTRQLQAPMTASIDLANNLITAHDTKAIAVSLVRDKRIVSVDLSNNKLGPLGVMYISEMLVRNSTLMELDLSQTFPGPEGLEVLGEAMQHSGSLQVLKLEGNNIEHTEVKTIVKVMQSVRLQELYLGHNSLGYQGFSALASAIETNTTLRILDLQWNHIRRDSAKQVCKAIAANKGLRTLNLAWNGLGKEGCIALCRSLPKNVTLQELDLNSNRIDTTSLRFLLHGLVHNTCLKCVRIGRNPLTTDGAKAILRALQSSKKSVIQDLILEDVSVDDEFMTLLTKLQETKKMKVVHGEILSSGMNIKERKHDPHDLNRFDPVLVLVEYMRIDNLRLIDFFQYLDTTNREQLSRTDFRDGVANLRIPLTEHHLDIVMQTLDLKHDGYVDLEEFMTVQRDVQRQITNRTTRARRRTGKDDEGLLGLRKILKELIEKRNKENKEKAAARRFSLAWNSAVRQASNSRRFSDPVVSMSNEQQEKKNPVHLLEQLMKTDITGSTIPIPEEEVV